MKANQFNLLSEEQQRKVMCKRAVFLLDKEEGPLVLSLYQIEGFYVEVFYNQVNIYNQIKKKVIMIRGFDALEDLSPYLELIQLPKLV